MTELPTNKIILCIDNKDDFIEYSQYGLSFDSSETEVLERLSTYIEEKFGESIKDHTGWLYKTRKALDSKNIFIIPNSTAG